MRYFIILLLTLVSCQYFTKHYKKLPIKSKRRYIGMIQYQRVFPTKYAHIIEFEENIEPITFSQSLKNWLFHQKLGEGASAQVFLVQDLETSQFRVMKIYQNKIQFNYQNYILNKLGQKVQWFFCSERNNTLALYEQFENSKNLSDINYTQRQIKILAKIHEKGFIHTDIKPNNMLIDSKLRNKKYTTQRIEIKIIDWNLSQSYYLGKMLKKHRGSRKYMSPEIIFDSKFYTPAVDVWSFGMLMVKITNNGYNFIQPDKQLQSLIQMFGLQSVKKLYDKIRPQLSTKIVDQFKKVRDIKHVGLDNILQQNITTQQLTFIKKVLILDPQQRPSFQQLLKDQYFSDVTTFDPPGLYKQRRKAQLKKNKKSNKVNDNQDQ